MRSLIRLTENATGRTLYITKTEYELLVSEIFSFDDLYELYRYKELACNE